MAWQKVAQEVADGTYTEFSQAERRSGQLAAAEEDAKDEIWAAPRYVVLSDNERRMA